MLVGQLADCAEVLDALRLCGSAVFREEAANGGAEIDDKLSTKNFN